MRWPFLSTRLAIARALELRCTSPHSSYSKRTVAWLSGQSVARKEDFLFNSVLWGLPNLVRCALEAGVSASSRSDCHVARPVLVQAAFLGKARILKQLQEAGADHSLTDSQGFTSLHSAAHGDHVDCIELLLGAGADADTRDAGGLTPLMTAILSKHADSAKALLPASDLSVMNPQGRTAFHLCITTANEECFDLLLPRDVDERTAAGMMPTGEPVPVFHLSPLHLACHKGQHRMAKSLLKCGAERMARDSLGTTPLMYAKQGGHLACVVLLLGQPGRFKMTAAEVDAADSVGVTALHAAAFHGHIKICGVLLEAGTRLDTKSSQGATPLMLAQREQPTNAALLALLSGDGPAHAAAARHCVRPLRQDGCAGIGKQLEGVQSVPSRALLRRGLQRGSLARAQGGVGARREQQRGRQRPSRCLCSYDLRIVLSLS